MKYFSFVKVTFVLLAISVIASAQQASTGSSQAGAPAGIVKGKLAFINTAAFQEDIGEFKARFDTLNRQFETRVKGVQSKADRITALENTIKTQSNVLTPAKIAEMTEQLEREKRSYDRDREDLEAEASRARDQALTPIREKLSRFVQDYTTKRGIVMLIDLANAVESNTIIWYDPRADVTKDFVAEYNKANPVPTAPAAAKQP